MPMENAGAIRMARAQIARRLVDSSRLDVRVVYGTVYVTGILAKLREHPEVDLTKEVEMINLTLRSRLHVHNVIWEAKIRS